MIPLQQKFLKANRESFIADGGASLAKASEQICIEEKIELLLEIERSTRGISAIPLSEIESKISELQNQLNNLK